MWTIIWIAIVVAVIVIGTILSMYCGRGHLGVNHSERHYLDEVESMYHHPWM